MTRFWSATPIRNRAHHARQMKYVIYLILRVCPRTGVLPVVVIPVEPATMMCTLSPVILIVMQLPFMETVWVQASLHRVIVVGALSTLPSIPSAILLLCAYPYRSSTVCMQCCPSTGLSMRMVNPSWSSPSHPSDCP